LQNQQGLSTPIYGVRELHKPCAAAEAVTFVFAVAVLENLVPDLREQRMMSQMFKTMLLLL